MKASHFHSAQDNYTVTSHERNCQHCLEKGSWWEGPYRAVNFSSGLDEAHGSMDNLIHFYKIEELSQSGQWEFGSLFQIPASPAMAKLYRLSLTVIFGSYLQKYLSFYFKIFNIYLKAGGKDPWYFGCKVVEYSVFLIPSFDQQ